MVQNIRDTGGPPDNRQRRGGCIYPQVGSAELDLWGAGEPMFSDYGGPIMAITTTEVRDTGDGRVTKFNVTPGSWGAGGSEPAGSAEPGIERERLASRRPGPAGSPKRQSLDLMGLFAVCCSRTWRGKHLMWPY